MARIVLVDDHQIFREGLRALLSLEPDLSVVGEAASARECYDVVTRCKPDLVLLDVVLPGTSGVTAVAELLQIEPHIKVVMVSMLARDELVTQALRAGARGYVLKDQSASELVQALRVVLRGEIYIAPRLAQLRHSRKGERQQPIETLSYREHEIFRLLVRGYSNDAVAQELEISVKTVQTHRTHIYRKLEVHSTADLVRLAARHGLIDEVE